MKVGDLVKVVECPPYYSSSSTNEECECFFCFYESSRIGIVKEQDEHRRGCQMWIVQFDCGEWELSNDEAEVISEK